MRQQLSVALTADSDRSVFTLEHFPEEQCGSKATWQFVQVSCYGIEGHDCPLHKGFDYSMLS